MECVCSNSKCLPKELEESLILSFDHKVHEKFGTVIPSVHCATSVTHLSFIFLLNSFQRLQLAVVVWSAQIWRFWFACSWLPLHEILSIYECNYSQVLVLTGTQAISASQHSNRSLIKEALNCASFGNCLKL